MLEELRETIRKNLPAQVSEQLQHYLLEANAAKKENIELIEENKHLKILISKHEGQQVDLLKLNNDRVTLKEDRQKFEIERRDERLKVMIEKYNDVRSLMHDVFRNQRMIYKSQEQGSVSVFTPQGYPTQQPSNSTTETEMIQE